MKKKLLVGSIIAISLLTLAFSYVYFFYLPEILLERLPHNISAQGVSFNLTFSQITYHKVKGPAKPGCQNKQWLNAKTATVKLKDFKPISIELANAKVYVEKKRPAIILPQIRPTSDWSKNAIAPKSKSH